MSLKVQLVYLGFLLVLSGFFSGSEVALVSLSRLKLRQMLEKKRKGIIFVKKLKEDPRRMLSTILIGNNLANVAASALATSISISIFNNSGVGIAIGVMTFLILIFGEITPKTIATEHNETVSLLVARPLWYLSIILSPILKILDFLIGNITNVLGITHTKKIFTEEDVKTILKEAEEVGSVKEIEEKMIHKIFEFDDINTSEIMTHKVDMVLIKKNSKLNQIIDFYLKKPFSRIPVYDKSKDNIVGIVYVKDILKYLKEKKNVSIDKVMRKPYFVPGFKKIDKLMKHFQKRKEHMAIVVNEHGSVIGLVTLEDVVEEIVGEIMDETDKVDPDFKKINPKEWVVKGKADVEEINEKIKMGIKEEGFDTLSGFILHKTGNIPKKDEVIKFGKFILKVEELEGNRISSVRILRK